MLKKIKTIIAKLFPNFVLFLNYYSDYKQYSRYQYSARGISFEKCQGKIYRQTHIIEKGMSLSHPRKDFGKAKIQTLFSFLDEYLAAGYPPDASVFINAVNVLKRYVAFQKELCGVEEPVSLNVQKVERKLAEYAVAVNDTPEIDCGIHYGTKEYMQKMCEQGFEGVVQSRHSMRQFSDEEIDGAEIEKAVQMAMHAPSECNRQSVKVYRIKQQGIKKKLDEFINGNSGFADEVKDYLIITSDVSSYTDAYERNQMYVDGALFAMTLMLSLHSLGIASCALQHGETMEKNKLLRNMIDIPPNERVIMFIAIGHYKEKFAYAVSKRKELHEVLKEI